MGKFKEYIITEDINLSNLGHKLNTFFNSPHIEDKISQVLGPKYDKNHPAIKFSEHPVNSSIPSTERSGTITSLMLKKNPIYVRLSDGTEAHFTYDEYRKIEGQLALGKTMTITFQRHPTDGTSDVSKIEKVIVHD